MNYKEKYEMALEKIKNLIDKYHNDINVDDVLNIFPELKESEDEQIRKELTKHLKEGVEGYMPAGDSSDYRRWLDWLEKQCKSSDQIHYWTEEEIEPIISDYLRGAEHYGGMIARLRCLKPKSLEKQGEQKQLKDYSTLEITDVVRQALQECESFSNIRKDLYAARVGATVEYLIKKRSEQKSAWSKEDDCMLESIISDFYAGHKSSIGQDKWLKSLKQRYTWKPSDEQIKVCKEVYADLLSAKGFDLGTVNSELNRMEEQLKKLREE